MSSKKETKVSVEINEILEREKTINKICGTKSWFFKKINNSDKL
jgi:hypothetical protein